jgi:peroxiredoxin
MKDLFRTGSKIVLALIWLGLAACQEVTTLESGSWRGVFWVDQEAVPIDFEIVKIGPTTSFVVSSGTRSDTFALNYVGKDSVHISPETFEYKLFAKNQENGKLTGEFRNLAPGNTSRILRFEAEHGKSYRFVEPGTEKPPIADLSGNWSLTIEGREGPTSNRVAVFSQDQNAISGVVLAVTGDTRELQGEVSGNKFWLSGFSGIGVTLVEGEVDNEGRLLGKIGFGERALRFTGVRNEGAALADAYSLTYLKPGYEKLSIKLPNLNGDTVSLSDEKYKGKVVVIDILGSWCPNCIDQIEFLNPWYEQNKDRGVEVLGVAFEVKDDIEFAKKVMGRVIDKYGIKYDVLFGGKPDSENVQSKFEALNTFLAFPTTIIVGRDGTVKSIHTGFSGKDTGKYYEEFVEKWNRDMDLWLSESPR